MSTTSVSNLFAVNGLVVVVTGGGSGLGLMMAKALEENGAKVYIVGRRKDKLDQAALQAKHGNIIPLQADVTSRGDLNRIVDTIAKADGFINTLICNSGISGPTPQGLPPNPTVTQLRDFSLDLNTDEFTNTYHVNTSAVFFTTMCFLELLDAGNKKGNVEQKSQVITTSSIGGFNRMALAGYAYGTSKAATIHLMKQFATAFVPYHIRANTIAPGLYPSEMADDIINRMKAAPGGIPQSVVPLQRAGTPEDMAGTVLYLASRAGAYCNGNVLVTDGGRLSVCPSTY